MLRHYDKLGLLRPGHVDQWTGYRYYTLQQLPRLHRIMALKDLGLSLEQVGQLVAEGASDDRLEQILRQRQKAIESQLVEEQARLTRVLARLQQIERVYEPIPFEVVLKELPTQNVIAIREVVPHVSDMGTVRDRLFRHLYQRLNAYGIAPGTEIAIYHFSEYSENDIDTSLAVEVADSVTLPVEETVLQCATLPSGLAASIAHHGSLWQIPDVVIGLYRWLGMNGYTSAGDYREVHWFGRELDLFEGCNPDEAVFEILVPIEPLI